MDKQSFTVDEAIKYGKEIGIDWANSKFDPEEFRKGMDIELEHGTRNSDTNLTDDDPVKTAKITLAHLKEISDYNTRLLAMEKEAKGTKVSMKEFINSLRYKEWEEKSAKDILKELIQEPKWWRVGVLGG